MQKKNIWHLTGVHECAHGETPVRGQACEAVNVRRTDNALTVTGVPATAGHIGAGETLILADLDGRLLSLINNEIRYNGTTVTTLSGTFLCAHSIGPSLVAVVTTEGITTLLRTDDGYTTLTPADALPQLSFTATAGSTMRATVDGVDFDNGYSEWGGTLTQTDVKRVLTALQAAWQQLSAQGRAAGVHTAPMLVRYGVRLFDDSYLYLSEPVLLGTATMANATPLRTDITTETGKYVATENVILEMQCYALTINVTAGPAQPWHTIVKAIDVLTTDEVAPVATTNSLAYRCLTVSGAIRRPMLEFGFTPRAQSEVAALLARERWRVVASCSDLNALNNRTWSPDAEPYNATLTAEQAADITRRQQLHDRPTAAMVLAGRLNYTTADGMLVVCVPGNPLVPEQRRLTGGTGLRAICAAPRTLYASGFGRYPAFVFSDEGVFAMPLTGSNAQYGEPRLVSRLLLARGSTPVEGGKSVFFLAEGHRLCRLHGNNVTILLRNVDVLSMTYDNVHNEMHVLLTDGRHLAFGDDDTYTTRTLHNTTAPGTVASITQFYGNASIALAVDNNGNVLNLTDEQSSGLRPFCYRSQWVSLGNLTDSTTSRRQQPHLLAWDICGNNIDATLTLRTTQGIGNHYAVMSAINLTGSPTSPVVTRVPGAPPRRVQIEACGTAQPNTVIRVEHTD